MTTLDIVSVISNIKEKIKKINEEERLKTQSIKVIPMEDIVLGEKVSETNSNSNSNNNKIVTSSSSNSNSNSSSNNSNNYQYNSLLHRQLKLTHRKQHVVSPVALEGRFRELLGINNELPIVNTELQDALARSQAQRYYKISESDNLHNDIGIEQFQKPWGKLDSTLKINRLLKYATTLQVEYSLNETDFRNLRIMLIDAVNNKKLNKKNSVQYNEELGIILDIQGLIYNPDTKNFTFNQKLRERETEKVTEKEEEKEIEKEKEKEIEIATAKNGSEEVTALNIDEINLLSKKKMLLK